MTLYIRPDGSKAVEVPNALPGERKKLRRASRGAHTAKRDRDRATPPQSSEDLGAEARTGDDAP